MASKRKYNIKGSKDFIVLAGIFFFLCLWSIKDAWYTSPKTIEKHPREVMASFEVSGALSQLHVKQGSSVGENQLIAELSSVKKKEAFDAAKEVYIAAKQRYSLAEESLSNVVKKDEDNSLVAELEQEKTDAKAAMDAALVEVDAARDRVDACRLLSPSKGVVKELRAAVYDQVEAGEPVVVIDPKDHFYLFNKSLAVFSFVAFWIFLGIHILAL